VCWGGKSWAGRDLVAILTQRPGVVAKAIVPCMCGGCGLQLLIYMYSLLIDNEGKQSRMDVHRDGGS